jgi:DNA-binding MarR family transcriptional regulator
MHLGRTDMTALRLMLRAGQAGRPLTAAALARGLEISTAATTVLVDRLEKSGHAERRRSATDGRSIEIWPSAAADQEVRRTMGLMHERMMAVAGSLSQAECRVVRRFLEALAAELAELDFPPRTDTRPS